MSPGDGRLAYSPALDGVRAIAVTAVLAFHAEVGPFRGGFLGVSVFFTLSGYLIASLLLAERRATGSIRLSEFYLRRARRLLPAAWLTIALVVLATPWWSAGQRADLPADTLAALAQVYNWKVAFAPDDYANIFAGEPSPLAHFWSLAIEEQFYLVVPALLALALARTGHIRGLLMSGVGAGMVGAAIASIAIDDADVVYNATFTRAGELLAGVMLALAIEHRSVPKRIADVAGMVGFAAIAVLTVTATLASSWVYDGGLLGVAAASCALVIGAHHGALVPRALGVSVLAAIGRVSYGLYLFHWPVFILLTPARTGIDGPALLVVRIAATAMITLASYRVLEVPVRRSRRPGRPFLVLSATVAAVSLLVIVSIGVDPTTSTQVLASPAGAPDGNVRFDATSSPASASEPAPPNGVRSAQADAALPESSPDVAAPVRVLVLGGDARAVPAVRHLGSAVEVVDLVEPGCPLVARRIASRCDGFDISDVDGRDATMVVIALSRADVVDAGLDAKELDDVAASRRRTEERIGRLTAHLASEEILTIVFDATDDAALGASLSTLQLRDHAFAAVATTTDDLRSAVDELLAGHDADTTDRPRVLVLGDSTSLPFATALYDDGIRFDVLWAGEHGCPTVAVVGLRATADAGPPSPRACPGLAAQTRSVLRDFAPELVVVVAGPSELVEQIYADGRSAIASDDAFAAVHDADMAALTEVVGATVPIVVATSPPIEVGAFSTADMTKPERLAGWNAQVERWAAQHQQVHVLDYGKALVEQEAMHGSIRPDGSHPTVDGLRTIIAATVAPLLSRVLAEP